jgi:AraC-like DNA-binding protein
MQTVHCPICRRARRRRGKRYLPWSGDRRLGVLRTCDLVDYALHTMPDWAILYASDMRSTDLPEAPLLQHFSTETLPERERFAAFREDFALRVMAMDIIDHSGGGQPRVDITRLSFGQVAVHAVSGTSTEFIRENGHAKDGRDDLVLCIVEAGPMRVWHAGEESFYNTGSAYLSEVARRCVLGEHGGGVKNITVPASLLAELVPHPEDLTGRPLHAGPALFLLHEYLRSLTALKEAPPPNLAHIIRTHLVDLTAAALGPTAEAREIIGKRGLEAARLRAILSMIAQRFSDPDFNLDSVAGDLGLSRRYIQRLLEQTGKSFTDHVVERRLDRAHAMLTDHRYLHRRIIDIAFSVGISDISRFNHTFRRRFGDNPSGVRGSANREK